MKSDAKKRNERNNNIKPNVSQTKQCKHYADVNRQNWKDFILLQYMEYEVWSTFYVYCVLYCV